MKQSFSFLVQELFLRITDVFCSERGSSINYRIKTSLSLTHFAMSIIFINMVGDSISMAHSAATVRSFAVMQSARSSSSLSSSTAFSMFNRLSWDAAMDPDEPELRNMAPMPTDFNPILSELRLKEDGEALLPLPVSQFLFLVTSHCRSNYVVKSGDSPDMQRDEL